MEAVALFAFPFDNHFSASSAEVIVCQLRPSTKIFSSVPRIFNDGLMYGDFGPNANASFVFFGYKRFLISYRYKLCASCAMSHDICGINSEHKKPALGSSVSKSCIRSL